MKKMCIYIHIPFCKKRCHYCSFFSSVNHNFIAPYFEALIKEINKCSERYKDYCIESIYFGGGTPSFVDAQYIENTLNALFGGFNVKSNAEISIECNPETFDSQKLGIYTACNINRYSLGLQTACDKTLSLLGRRHNFRQFASCVELLKNKGINNISCDIMLGLPNQTLTDVIRTLNAIIKLDIPHISAYGLSVEKGTKLYDMVKENKVSLPDGDCAADMYEYVYNRLKSNNIFRYEISNFAARGFECRHNINYWRRGEYLGFGASAHSFIDNVRFFNISNINEYIGGNTPAQNNAISKKEGEFEYIMLGLRMARGIDLEEYKRLYDKDFLQEYKKEIQKYRDYFIIKGQDLCLKDKGYYVINAILTEFMR